MMNINKLVLKGTGKISLHERFTQLSKFQVPAVKVGVSEGEWDSDYVRGSGAGGVTRAGVGRYGRGATRELSPEQQPHVTRVRPSSVPVARERSVDRPLYRPGPSAAVAAAAKLKRRSIHQRLGLPVRARLSLPVYRPMAARLGQRLGRHWGSMDSVASNTMQDRRRWTGFRRRRGGFLNRGVPRWGGFRNRNRWGQGRRGRGGRWRRGGQRRQPPPPSREQLDKEIDSYMSETKGFLDKQLDDYMMEAANV